MILQIETLSAMQRGLEKIKQFLAEEKIGETGIFHSKLVFSELVGNVLKHSSATAKVQCRIQNGFIEMSVQASDGFTPPQESSCSDVYEEGGRGLFLVYTLCEGRVSAEQDGIVVKLKRKA